MPGLPDTVFPVKKKVSHFYFLCFLRVKEDAGVLPDAS